MKMKTAKGSCQLYTALSAPNTPSTGWRAKGSAKDFKVDKEMIQEFKQVEKDNFQAVTTQEKQLVWGIFGTQDKLVNCQADFRKHYGTAQMQLFEGGHYLNDHVLSREVMPLVTKLLNL